MKKVIFLIMLLVCVSLVNADFGYNDYDGPILTIDPSIFNNNTAYVNSTEWWITSIGSLDNVDASQHNNVAGVLTISETYLRSFGDGEWLEIDGGNSPTANINWGGFNLNNVDVLVGNNINITSSNTLEPIGIEYPFNTLTIGNYASLDASHRPVAVNIDYTQTSCHGSSAATAFSATLDAEPDTNYLATQYTGGSGRINWNTDNRYYGTTRGWEGTLSVNTGVGVTTAAVNAGMRAVLSLANSASISLAGGTAGKVSAHRTDVNFGTSADISGDGVGEFGGIIMDANLNDATFTHFAQIYANPVLLSGGTGTNIYGIYLGEQDAGTINWQIYNDGAGNNFLGGDNAKQIIGTGEDTAWYMDGADTIMNAEVGGQNFNFTNWDSIKIDGNLEQTNGNATINMIYGEMWNYTSAGWTFDIDAADIYYNLTGLIDDANGFTFVDNPTETGGSHMIAQVKGLYKLDFSMSFKSIAVGGEFGISIAHDYDPDTHRNCYARREAATDIGNVGITCVMDLEVGDPVAIMIENENTNRDIIIYTVNMNVLRIGDI